MVIIDNTRPLYSCPKCYAVLAFAAESCPVCTPVGMRGFSTQPYSGIYPHTIGVRGGCSGCCVTHSEYEVNGRRYCRACFDERFTLIEKPVERKGDI